jgi:phage shock protein A
MSYSKRPGFFARLRSLLRGNFSLWVKDKELENPEAVYEQAIAERVRQYRELKSAVAGILYMRTKLESEVTERRAEIARLHDDVRRAVRCGQDDTSLALIERKQALFEELERSESDLQSVRNESEEAKNNLVRYREEIRSLVREKGRMLATLANTKARRRLQVAIEGLSIDAEMDALESVREQVSRMVVADQIDDEIGDDSGLRVRLREFRTEARNESARRELEQLKDEMTDRTLASSARESAPISPPLSAPVSTGLAGSAVSASMRNRSEVAVEAPSAG